MVPPPFVFKKKPLGASHTCTRSDISKLNINISTKCEACHKVSSDQCLLVKDTMDIIQNLDELSVIPVNRLCVMCALCILQQKHGEVQVPFMSNYERVLNISRMGATSGTPSLTPKEELQLRKCILFKKKMEEEECFECYTEYDENYAYAFHFHYKDIRERFRDPLSMMKYINKYTVSQYIDELEKCELYCATCYLEKLIRTYDQKELWKCVSILSRMTQQSL